MIKMDVVSPAGQEQLLLNIPTKQELNTFKKSVYSQCKDILIELITGLMCEIERIKYQLSYEGISRDNKGKEVNVRE